ncbi:ABC transporter permease [Candidatus Peregrinibacteria bacterium]|nr:ABC transporter permease [Candidatus Peregrinibacteria bacterium]
MKLRYTFKTAVLGLRAHKSRSALTILGIVIGIMAIILVMSIGQGAEQLILNQIQGFGSRTISVEPGREPKGPADIYEMFTDSLKEKDFKALQNPANVHGDNKVEPFVAYVDTVAYENETKRTNIYGGSKLLLELFDVYPDEGVMFDDTDIRQLAGVAVIGENIKEELFGESDALGKKIKIKDKTFRIVGLLPKKGRVMMMDVDDMVIVPYTTAQKYLLGIKHFHAILIQAETEESVPLAVEDIKRTLRELHGITDPDKDDFRVETMQDAVDRISIITSVLTLLLVSVAGISLVVGGIGIMNIMLVSVTERTREIGLRKALGATSGDVLTQFLLEAIILTVVGGIFGISGGALFSWLTALGLTHFGNLDWDFVFPLTAVFLGVGVSATVGLVFGIYPAKQAARKSPIEALRYE